KTAASALRRAVGRILPFGSGPVMVKGQGDVLAYLAKCCSPVPGEELVGYVTRGRGVSVHSVDCPNVRNFLYDPEREIEVEWARQNDTVYPVPLMIRTEDHPGMLARLTEAIAKESSNIRQFEAEAVETGMGLIGVVVEVKNSKHLARLRRAIGNVQGVLQVSRRRAGVGGAAEDLA
ncbi:MAG: bifunctional (p)ppGpp synthetase/guanosine-3',5'-bis(diphosphate) 3'-pyrophosphohydrolase, partial [Thermoanaerobaculia bacterium]|nr:bifunctional (p)ppGpp synthetase/guanosine-3',5'-bis(diphosphate) 3'-pyrophosphohydrolase [Thermoanaerobaculia bacterium]